MFLDLVNRGLANFRAKDSEIEVSPLKRCNAMYKPVRPVIRRASVKRKSGKYKKKKKRIKTKKLARITMDKNPENSEIPEGIISAIPWVLKWRNRRVNPDNPRLQQIDGGFFERFGSLLQESSEIASAEEDLQKVRAAEEAAKVIESIPEEESADLPQDHEDDTSGSASELGSLDSEEEGKDNTECYLSTAMNIDELYLEILFEILHNIGCDVACGVGKDDLFLYLQDAFKMSNQRHSELLEEAEQKEAPEILLNVEVIEAKDLRPKDSNGLSDPFVTLFLSSNSSRRYNTSVKTATLNPTWEEHFALPISKDGHEDTLCLEVWDFDPAESIKEKLGKIFEVKGVKGIRKLFKEIAVTAATGQHESEFIGSAKIPLTTVPASGMTMWYSLDKKNKITRQGVVKLRLSFCSEKNCQVAAQEHKHLLKMILLHELESSKVTPYWWSGTFSNKANAILTQHIAQSGLQIPDVALSQYAVYTLIHLNHPLSFNLFSSLLDKLIKPVQVSGFSNEDARVFWESTKKLLPSVFSLIRKVRRKCNNDKAMIKQFIDALHIVAKLSDLEVPEDYDLFPESLYPWIRKRGDVRDALDEAVVQGANDWFDNIIENNTRQDDSEIGKLKYLVRIIQLVRSDLQKAVEFYDKLLNEIVNYAYSKTLYKCYESKIASLVEPEVMEICKSLKRLSYIGFSPSEEESTEPLSVGTTLFELYLAIQRFILLGSGLCPNEFESFKIADFHSWFYGGVAQWLDIAVFKALTRIEKAVELDALSAVDDTVKYSSSAVDTLAIFYQIKIFWQQLNWPDVEGCYTFIAKIIDDICKCSVFYADNMASRVDGMGDTKDMYEQKFQVTQEWCLAINNIDYVRQSLIPFTEELGKDEVIVKLSELRSPLEAQRCQQTLDNVILNSVDTVKNKIIELLEIVVNKMCPSMKRLLVEGAEVYSQDCNSIDRVMMYVDNNLAMLHAELNEDNFNKTLAIIWDNLGIILQDLIQSNLEKRRPPAFFANLYQTLNIMMKSFKSSEDSSCPELARTEQLLKLNGMETPQLIHQINLELHEEATKISDSNFGQLTIRAKFHNTDLHVEVMNARNLIAMDSNGACDSFVRIHLLPEEKFYSVTKPKTQTHYKNIFPLYDEKFEIVLSSEQHNCKDGLVLFSVKDYDLMGYNNQYIGESFLHFKDIPKTQEPIETLPQVTLELIRPTNLGTDAIKVLEYRQGDKQAKDFIKKLKQRMGTNNGNN